jgi:hypothetical protein
MGRLLEEKKERGKPASQPERIFRIRLQPGLFWATGVSERKGKWKKKK